MFKKAIMYKTQTPEVITTMTLESFSENDTREYIHATYIAGGYKRHQSPTPKEH